MNFYSVNRGVFKRLHKYFSYRSVVFVNRKHLKKRVSILNCNSLEKSQIKEAKKFYNSFGFKNISIISHKINTHFSGIFRKEYLPEDLFHSTIEPCLNDYRMAVGLTDKNYFTRLFKGIKHPETVIKNINGVFYDDDIVLNKQQVIDRCNQFKNLIIKPSIDSFGGKNIIVFNLKEGITDYKNQTLEQILASYKKNYIIQSFLKQNKKMKSLNPTSVNTLRIVSLFWNNQVNILHSIVRIGRINSYVDNTGQGGVFCQIEPDGNLLDKGFDGDSNIYHETDTKIKFVDFKIPFYDRVEHEVKELHMQIPHFKLISWDLAIDNLDETVLIEYNVMGQGVDAYEYTNGPFFGEFTEEVLKYCSQLKPY
ncbi:sugar-transfer associated ATP-grasp domain-containing protein [Aureibaculum sp. 2210JD6-5]|uniref:sugar-transfer associated ATP-grasp domain-containing protein n=1 Tax=Aureibaculum sp. 2210JD6-5 TaxID=3103957 RepID=UPI002AADBB4C|nr:sugar-transfer associated ATP-grasp domain-containing protein [Aureibaculum sp. 2210JD6-5]MDY7394081.1 sugar-transfer associated ATP-grasp domain-containing protein [Aureibaculum sp. 2210JD6-5]